MFDFSTYLSDPSLWELFGPTLLAKSSGSTSHSETHVTTSSSFNPVISLGSAGDPVKPDTTSTFARELLSTDVKVTFDSGKEPDALEPVNAAPLNTPLVLATLGLLLWRQRKGR